MTPLTSDDPDVGFECYCFPETPRIEDGTKIVLCFGMSKIGHKINANKSAYRDSTYLNERKEIVA